MNTWLRWGALSLSLVLAPPATGVAAKDAKSKDTVRLDTTTTQPVRKPATTIKSDAKVDTFVDKNNDGIDDRRQPKVVRPERTAPKQEPAEGKEVKEGSVEKPKQKKPPRRRPE